MNSIARLVLLVSVVALSGCVAIPSPRHVLVVPEVEGRLVRDSLPVAGATISYHRIVPSEGCLLSQDVAVTDDDGRFRIPRRTEFRFWAFMGDPSNRWGICIGQEGTATVGWVGRGLGVPPEVATFECELTSSPVETGRGRGICRLVGI